MNTLQRKHRSTQFEMHCRRQHVTERLQDGPKSLNEIFGDTDWTYAQAVITLRTMQDDRVIQQVGKNGREVIYSLREDDDVYPDFEKLSQHVSKGDLVKIVGLHVLEDEGYRIDLRFPNGDEVEARLVS